MTKEEVYAFLDSKGVEYEAVAHNAVFTVDEMIDAELPYPERIAKNLFVRDDKKKNYYLITVLEHKRVDLKEFRKEHETRPLSFASEDDLKAIMDLYRGAVTPFGILSDKEAKVQVFFDSEFAEGSGVMGIHPCDNTATVFLKTEDVVNIVREHGNAFEYCEISTRAE